jgi:hypothetical protein
METVKITANKEGQVFTTNANLGKDGKQYGYIRVESQVMDFSGAVAKVKTRSALISMTAEDFAKTSLKNGAALNGKIVFTESLIKIGNAEAKRAGEKGEILTSGGQPIYRYSKFTSDQNATDVLIAHENVLVASAAGVQA